MTHESGAVGIRTQRLPLRDAEVVDSSVESSEYVPTMTAEESMDESSMQLGGAGRMSVCWDLIDKMLIMEADCSVVELLQIGKLRAAGPNFRDWLVTRQGPLFSFF